MRGGTSLVRRATRAAPRKTRWLYVADASGLVDEQPVYEVSLDLYLRCQSILTVTEALNLLHAFHWEPIQDPGRPMARNLVYAKNTQELLAFLDALA